MRTQMKFWMTITLILVIGLGGCAAPPPASSIQTEAPLPPQSTATPPPSDPVVTETLAASVNEVKGLWYMKDREGAMFSLNGEGNSSDLTYSYVWMQGGWAVMDTGTAKFENGKLTFLTSTAPCPDNGEATYEIYIVKETGLVTGMRGKALTPDNCTDRPFVVNEFMSFADASLTLMSKGTERPPSSGAELFGAWYDESGVLRGIEGTMDFDTGNASMLMHAYYVLQDPWMTIGISPAKYENGKLIFRSNTGFCEDVGEAIYEVSVIVYNDKVIGIHPRVIGDDLCADRKNTFDNRILRSFRP